MTLTRVCVCVRVCREIEHLKVETAQRLEQEQIEATHREETDNLQEKVSEGLCERSSAKAEWSRSS